VSLFFDAPGPRDLSRSVVGLHGDGLARSAAGATGSPACEREQTQRIPTREFHASLSNPSQPTSASAAVWRGFIHRHDLADHQIAWYHVSSRGRIS
jgi:hypothetical protein